MTQGATGSEQVPAAVQGRTRTLVLAGTGLAVVVWLFGFFSPLGLLQVQPALLLGGGLLAGASLLPKAARLLVPAAVTAAVGFLALLPLAVAASQFAVGGIEIVALVLAFLEAAALATAVLVDAGLVSLPAPKPAAPQGYGGYQQPYQGGYPPPQGGGYQQQPNPYAYGYGPQQPYGYPQQQFPGQQPYPQQGWAPTEQAVPAPPTPAQGTPPVPGRPAPGPYRAAPGEPSGQAPAAPAPTEAEQTRIEPTEGRHSGVPAQAPEGDRTTKITVDPERREG
jgi:hypothetical protein